MSGAGEIFASAAPYYSRYRQPYDPRVFAAVVTALGLGTGSTVLDLGTGTGAVALGLAPLVGRVARRLGDRRSAFEADLRAALLAVDPAGATPSGRS